MASPFAFSLKKASGESEVGGEKDGVLPHAVKARSWGSSSSSSSSTPSTNTTTKSWQTAPFSDATFDGGGASDLPTSSVECGSAFNGGGSERKPTFIAPSYKSAVLAAGSSTFSFAAGHLISFGAAPVFSAAATASAAAFAFKVPAAATSTNVKTTDFCVDASQGDEKDDELKIVDVADLVLRMRLTGEGKMTIYDLLRQEDPMVNTAFEIYDADRDLQNLEDTLQRVVSRYSPQQLHEKDRRLSYGKGQRFIAAILKEKAFIRCLADFTSVSQTVRLLNTCRSLHEVEAEVFCNYRLPRVLVDKEAFALCRAMVGTPVKVKPQPGTSYSRRWQCFIPPEPRYDFFPSAEWRQWKQERENEYLCKEFGILPANTVYDSSRWFAWFDTSEVQDLKLPNWITDEQMLCMLGDGRFPKLKSLEKSCQNGKNISDSTVAEVARRFPGLQSLAITYSGITDVGVIAVANGCPNLKSINFWSCEKITDASVCEVVKKCRHLQSLLLGACKRITDTSVIEIARGCPHLQKLSLASCGTITDDVMVEIARGCPHLKSLDVRNSYYITDITVLAIAHNCPSLQKLNVGNCKSYESITDESVMEIARCCPHLQSLKLGECKYVDDASIMEVGRRCPHLRELDVGCCKNIGDASIIEIARGCPHLQRLELYQCHRITNASIFAVANRCPDLQLLQLFACDKITDQSLASVVKGCPNIKNIRRPGLFG